MNQFVGGCVTPAVHQYAGCKIQAFKKELWCTAIQYDEGRKDGPMHEYCL